MGSHSERPWLRLVEAARLIALDKGQIAKVKSALASSDSGEEQEDAWRKLAGIEETSREGVENLLRLRQDNL
jgi:hypothetical protein